MLKTIWLKMNNLCLIKSHTLHGSGNSDEINKDV